MIERFYTIKEIAELLNVTPRTVQRYITDKKLPAQKIMGKWRVKESDFKKFIGQ